MYDFKLESSFFIETIVEANNYYSNNKNDTNQKNDKSNMHIIKNVFYYQYINKSQNTEHKKECKTNHLINVPSKIDKNKCSLLLCNNKSDEFDNNGNLHLMFNEICHDMDKNKMYDGFPFDHNHNAALVNKLECFNKSTNDCICLELEDVEYINF
ncbi:hypothetical protein PFFVO_03876 [Plasmodium falciparum Vietnam Oak-Knoll (FVO)]|uniref:Uncharacterized protein n=1 Tax=Plasmodium falciparum Vietnam Oak-Knoll (FVO) TaxID=1036723 RepID=A0A024V3B1_PLAFA|nr:hypothetical protein PFFVO_03876 [Plasmodium falciparum Vietnam Oak-Knoll (FVO)]